MAALTAQIKNAATIQAVLCTHIAHERRLDHIHLSACWTSLARQARQRLIERCWLQTNAEVLEPLMQQTMRTIMRGALGGRELANVAYGGARSNAGQSLGSLFAVITKEAKTRMDEFNEQELANTAWAFATVAQQDAQQLFIVLARTSEARLGEFNTQHLANTAWAFATLNQQDTQLATALAKSSERHLDEFKAQELANTAWAFATVTRRDAQHANALAGMATWRLNEFNALEVANTAWAFAKMAEQDTQLFTALARTAGQRLNEFEAENLANTAWAFATIAKLDAHFFTALAGTAERRLDDFNAYSLAITAWALATVTFQDAQLFTALARVAERRMEEFKAQELANTAWAFATMSQQDAQLFMALSRTAEGRLDEFNVRGLTSIVCAFDQLGIWQIELMQKIGAAASMLIHQFHAEDLLTFVEAYARAGGMDESWEKAVASQRELKYTFHSMKLDLALNMQVPSINYRNSSCTSADKSRFRSGMALWSASFVLAEFLSRHGDFAWVSDADRPMGGLGTLWNSWKGKTGVELGAGLGLPSIVASNLGAQVIATDGDSSVLQLLGMNTEQNAPSCQVKQLLWGTAEPLGTLGLKQDLDFVLAADVVYGSDPNVWDALVETINRLAGPGTVVLIANVRRTRFDARPFYNKLQNQFQVISVSQGLLHPEFRGDGEGSCLIHMLKRIVASKEREQDNKEGRRLQAVTKVEPQPS